MMYDANRLKAEIEAIRQDPVKLAEVRALVGKWFQVSRTYRCVACLPEGKTGKEALLEAATYPDKERWVGGMSEWGAGDFYLRCYATSKDLPLAEFVLFRQLGGGTYADHIFPSIRGLGAKSRV